MENLHKMMSTVAACAHEDRISYLPDDLIDLILQRLPIQDAVRTSILSKKWLYRWTTMPSLVFDEKFAIKFAKNGAFAPNGFIRIINRVLFFHKGPTSKFHLHIPNIVIDSLQEVDEWILMLSRKDVQEFILTNSNHRYRLPSFVFSCLELRNLKLSNCILRPPLHFQGFPYLESLHLICIDFESKLGEITISLPQLKQLTIFGCNNAENFNIKAPKLQKLCATDFPHAILPKLHSHCLTTVNLYSLKPKQRSAQVNMFFSSVSSFFLNMKSFETNGYFLKLYIAENVSKGLPQTVDTLTHLSLKNLKIGDRFQLQAVLHMLRNSPNLEELSLSNDQMGPGNIHFYVEPTLYRLNPPLSHLQNVNITSLEGTKAELLFIQLLLKQSPKLKSLNIRLQTNIDAHKRLKFAKSVMGFKRSSVNVEILIDRMPPLVYAAPSLN